MSDFTLADFSFVNRGRCKAWMGEADNLHHHLIGLAGGFGEVCNAVKKVDRARAGKKGGEDLCLDEVADELADVLIYLDLVAAHFGIDLAEVVARKFNATSEKYGFPHRI